VRTSVFSLLLVVTLGWPNTAPPRTASQDSREMLYINGAHLGLGMTQEEVFAALREKHLGVAKIDDGSSPTSSTWFLCKSPEDADCEPRLGQVTFKNNRLTLVTKRWTQSVSASDMVSALYAVAKDLQSRGLVNCRIEPKETLEPIAEIRYVQFSCGNNMQITVERMDAAQTPSVAVDQMLIVK
jgi:hypothetical protein